MVFSKFVVFTFDSNSSYNKFWVSYFEQYEIVVTLNLTIAANYQMRA